MILDMMNLMHTQTQMLVILYFEKKPWDKYLFGNIAL